MATTLGGVATTQTVFIVGVEKQAGVIAKR
jgi:hypothetical protein